jgi:hypothetical protein
MKYLKEFNKFNENVTTGKINETGEWPSDLDWQYVKDNPDDVDEYTSRIKYMADQMEDLKEILPEGFPFELINVEGFDNYQGAYATVKINDRNYKVWDAGEGIDELWIEDYKLDNTSEDNKRAGFQGNIHEISEALVATEKY